MNIVAWMLPLAWVVAAGTVLVCARRRKRETPREPFAAVFGPAAAEFEAHLDAVARQESRRLQQELTGYLAGSTGHVVVIRRAPNGVALELSDGRHLALRGVSQRTHNVLRHRSHADLLRPHSVDRSPLAYRLRLRGLTGDETEIYARDVVLGASHLT